MTYDLSLSCPQFMSSGRFEPGDAYMVRLAISGGPEARPTGASELTPFAKASECLTRLINNPFAVVGVTIAKMPKGEQVKSCHGDGFLADEGTYIVDYVFKVESNDYVWADWDEVANAFANSMSMGQAWVIGWENYCGPSSWSCDKLVLNDFWTKQKPIFRYSNGKFEPTKAWTDGTGVGFAAHFSFGFSNYPTALEPVKFIRGQVGPQPPDPGKKEPGGAEPPGGGLPQGASNWLKWGLFVVGALATYQLTKDKL